MKKLSLMLSFGFLAIFTMFMVVSVVSTHAAEESSPLDADICAEEYMDGNGVMAKNIYNNQELSSWGVMSLYHERTNDEFNTYIRKMIVAQSAAADATSIDPNNVPPEDENDCETNRDNYSTYCVAKNLLSDKVQGDGYLQYAQALECRRGVLGKDLQALMSGESLDEAVYTPVEAYPVALYQEAAALFKSAEADAIDREIVTAKRALDMTLSAYDELKTAWPMHTQYVKIYEDLVKYRDKLVEVRSHVEEFPSKFIDATTTKCT